VPTVARDGPFRFFFYSNEGSEDPHIHVERDGRIAKFWLDPVALAVSGHFSPVELREIERIVRKDEAMLMKAWNEFFGR
jgi:Domain of unknown function (DUF4160)